MSDRKSREQLIPPVQISEARRLYETPGAPRGPPVRSTCQHFTRLHEGGGGDRVTWARFT